eukprot:1598556-Prymnesium_polylepis.1
MSMSHVHDHGHDHCLPTVLCGFHGAFCASHRAGAPIVSRLCGCSGQAPPSPSYLWHPPVLHSAMESYPRPIVTSPLTRMAGIRVTCCPSRKTAAARTPIATRSAGCRRSCYA